MRGVGSAAFALGKALVNAIPVGVVGNDEDAAVGPCGGCKESHACQNDGKNPNCGESMHDGPGKGEGDGGVRHGEYGAISRRNKAFVGRNLTMYPGSSMLTGMNGFLAICGICREITG